MNEFKQKALLWAQKFKYVAWLQNNEISYLNQPFINCLAVSNEKIRLDHNQTFDQLKLHLNKRKKWLFGYFGYNLVEEIEEIKINKSKTLEATTASFFEPLHLILFNDDQIEIISSNKDSVHEEINSIQLSNEWPNIKNPNIECLVTKDEYLSIVNILKEKINKGDIYEINYSIEFYASNHLLNPLTTYLSLNTASPTPFSCFLKIDTLFVLCASPERFIKKDGNKIISQPIKGTTKRGLTPTEDLQKIKELKENLKERSENIMIVDLVRNDLSKTCIPGTVKVEELCGIYSFKHVHQMISTVVGKWDESNHPIDVIKDAFPMGSMTGAPKVNAMKLIEQFEKHQRGIYSGAIGYFTPEANFDFNVVIRSIVYNNNQNKLSFCVGSAITSLSDPEKEYEECLLKAKAIFQVLNGQQEVFI